MKIQDIKVVFFEWKGTPWKTNYRNIFGQDIKPSVIRITDEGIRRKFFLGSSKLGSEHLHKGILDFAKELLVEEIPKTLVKFGMIYGKVNRSVSF